ncbi:Phosphate regulon transcriptional regulatory protein PhoB (SphR) [hydrothermal vent metagenome]|uniref:Phosphate regulon transcriptional regulatory protein PhoB (SphR) n=1 Tax=hydrothermal vent metagenome TaxID=652676 RepID=A0A3B0UL90_9ZZZZ
MENKILVVEDDNTLLEMLAYNLTRQGYEVVTAQNGRSALTLARQEKPSLIILDIMLPGIDGFEVCRILRKEFNFPILMLTARTEEVDKIVGLEVGADDYLTKPFSMRELLARVKALLRRVNLIRSEFIKETAVNDRNDLEKSIPTLTFANLAIDQNRREVRLNGEPIHLKPKEFDLILFLADHQGIALSRDLLLDRVWGWRYDVSSRTVDVHVRWLRQKIEENPSKARRIVTVRGVGYRFEG